MSLISEIEKLKVRPMDWNGIELHLVYQDDVNIILDVVIEMINKTIRPEILAFADAMEAEMAKHDAKKGDSWKEMGFPDLCQMMFRLASDMYVREIKNLHDDPHDFIDLANYAMMLHWRAKNELKTDKD